MRGAVATLLVVLASVGCATANDDVSGEMIRNLERQVAMPSGAEPLQLYDRYYASDRIGKLNVVIGVYLRLGSAARQGSTPVPGIPRAYTMNARDLPIIADGGCGVITVHYDPKAKRLLGLACNGRG